MLTPDQIVSRNTHTASRIIAGEAIILTPQDSKIRNLNETGSRIWELLAEKPTLGSIIQRIHAEFNVSEAQAQSDVVAFLTHLSAQGLVTVQDSPNTPT
jgi:hypothetical protein